MLDDDYGCARLEVGRKPSWPGGHWQDGVYQGLSQGPWDAGAYQFRLETEPYFEMTTCFIHTRSFKDGFEPTPVMATLVGPLMFRSIAVDQRLQQRVCTNSDSDGGGL